MTPDTTTHHGDIRSRIDTLAVAVDLALEQLCSAIQPSVSNLTDGVTYALGLDLPRGKARGKRIRPVMCLMTAEDFGATLADAMPFAMAIELMHNFALVHDDIEDGDTVRRNRPAVWCHYGIAHGINIGDYLLVHTYRALMQSSSAVDSNPALRLKLIALMTEVLDHTHQGQALDMNARTTREFSMDDYYRLVREKTGHYLAAPLVGGAMIAGANDEALDILAQYGMHLGPMFQIADDVIDLTEGKGRAEIGSDLREGKRSYLVAWTLQRASELQVKRLLDILDKPRVETTASDVAWAIELFRECGAFDAARTECQRLWEQAVSLLDRLPATPAQSLRNLAEVLLHRQQ